MYKKHILLVTLLSGSSLVAMDHIQENPVLWEASHHEEEAWVTVCLNDARNVAITYDVKIPVRFARLIGALNELIEDPRLHPVWPLPNVTIDIWRLIEPLLGHVYRITRDASQAEHLRQEIIIHFGNLDAKRLIGVICALDYLDIPILLESAYEAVKYDKLLWEELKEIPFHIRNQIIMDQVFILLGEVPGRELAKCRLYASRVTSVCATQDGKIVTGSEDTTIRIWDMRSNQLTTCRGHEGRVTSVCVTLDGKIVSGSYDTTVHIWDISRNQFILCSGHQGKVMSVCVTKDGKIVSASEDTTVRVWDMEGNQLALCRGHEGRVTSVCVTIDGKIVSGSEDTTVRVWDMEGNQLALCRGHEGGVTSVCTTIDGKIVSGSWDTTVRVWDIEGNWLSLCRGNHRVNSICVTKDGKIVSGSWDNIVRVWDMKGNQLALCSGHQGEIMSVCVMKDGRIVSGSENGTVRVWDIPLLVMMKGMNEEQARALWGYVSKLRYNCDKQTYWREMEKILGEDAPLAPANINNNNNE